MIPAAILQPPDQEVSVAARGALQPKGKDCDGGSGCGRMGGNSLGVVRGS